MFSLRFLILLALSLTGPTAFAQAQTSDAASIAQSLRDVDEKMTNPDPDMRLAYLETIVTEGNVRKIDRAIRIAVASSNENLRALGFRAYVASTGSVRFELLLNQQEKQAIEEARSNNGRSGRRSTMPRYLDSISRANGILNVQFERAAITNARGNIRVDNRSLEYAMRGERMTFNGQIYLGGAPAACDWDLKPTKDLKIVGVMTCMNWARPVQIVASMY